MPVVLTSFRWRGSFSVLLPRSGLIIQFIIVGFFNWPSRKGICGSVFDAGTVDYVEFKYAQWYSPPCRFTRGVGPHYQPLQCILVCCDGRPAALWVEPQHQYCSNDDKALAVQCCKLLSSLPAFLSNIFISKFCRAVIVVARIQSVHYVSLYWRYSNLSPGLARGLVSSPIYPSRAPLLVFL